MADRHEHLLTTRQMADFVSDGVLRFDELVPNDINEAVIEELGHLKDERLTPDGLEPPWTGTPYDECYPAPSVIGEYLRLPQVQGIVESLVGLDCLFDHDWTHHIPAHNAWEQPLHCDAITDSLDPTFDIQLFYFPREIAEGEGGTRYVPGSHLHRVLASGLDRYQHICGDQRFSGPAGTVLVFHHGLWHAGQPNPSDTDRWMHKVRLNPTRPQVRRWNTDDLDELHNEPTDHVFARMAPDSVAHTLRRGQRWMGVTQGRNEQVQRARLWRYLTGDHQYDVDYYLTRLERRASLVD